MCIADGMTPEQFWNSTVCEINAYIEGIGNKEECRLKDLHYLASLVQVAVIAAFNPKAAKLPSYEEVQNKIKAEKRSNVRSGWEESKAFMKAVQAKRR